ncbi:MULTISPECIES: VacJ family lipoprotein [unclassified Pseudodesulfovibrio]|uniref:MlaA family lipoprotein n=1 Tax=unclassified Pseudodesulfovibrio TaxID=2661612 RepID=UPI000FEBBF15|nr:MULTISPECIES: VacJ family lipoprotein [unclassified Pseudodesulfovibrio]MCJ2165930.1 VacJ family lipoprotein [Pseudodesulfovibrio sp. S3-i]RWU02606.1 VacJ family lipoprotein [Pseudodesulfovibrio sp. S3]
MTRRVLIPLLLLAAMLVGACGPKVVDVTDPTANLEPAKFKTSVHRWPQKNAPELRFLEVYDPWEPMNRNLYEVNATLDKYVMYPAANVYKAVIPAPIRTGVDNVINNINEVPVFFNCLLQFRMKKAAITFSRFLINTTFGLGGTMDLASDNKSYPRQHEDVGQTLGHWGVGNGPYFVMPVMGPSNLRDTAGFGGDILLLYIEMELIYQSAGMDDATLLDLSSLAIRGLNLRANTAFSYHSTGSPFEYEMVRFIYTKKRELDIKR